ncbi:MAG TPA: SpoIIE family protein phosphatase [Bacteroidota bacterium]|nr:SpoIIE family protein phosphatase [Bacteroidota bacterium]
MPVKMLIVDDEPDLESLIRQRFRKQIRENEYEFVFAHNGMEALDRLVEHPETIMILSDINMPEMDGLTLLSRLGELNNPALKAVIVSAYGDMENIRTAMNRGAFDFVTKPIDFNDLEVTINKTLQHLQIIKRSLVEHEQLIAVQRDLNIAARIQQSILPRKFPAFPDRTEFDIYAQMITAKEVGGDFYDFFFIDNDRLAFVVGDVSGKGVPAAIFMAVSRTLLKALASQVVNPGECLRRLNTMLIPEKDEAMFVTIFYGVLNTRTGDVQYSNGGHNSPYLIRAEGTVEMLPQTGGLLLGMLPDLEYDVQKIKLNAGDTIFLYTDGVNEAMNKEQELFDNPRFVESLKKTPAMTLPEMIKTVETDVKAFTADAPQSDDITMFTVRYQKK